MKLCYFFLCCQLACVSLQCSFLWKCLLVPGEDFGHLLEIEAIQFLAT